MLKSLADPQMYFFYRHNAGFKIQKLITEMIWVF